MWNKASSSQSNSIDQDREELHRVVDLLSDYECSHLLAAVREVEQGDRFWEGDSGLFYNEYVKMRFFRIGSNAPTAPSLEHSAFVPLFVTKSYPGAETFALPAPPPLSAPLGETLQRRRSRRDYRTIPIKLEQLSALLHYGCGVTATVAAYGFERLPMRTFPTHGGLQSPEVYFWTGSVEGLPAGIFHYQPDGHRLELMQRGDFAERLRGMAFGEEYVAEAGLVFLLTGVYDRLRWKYGERAYRFVCMDIGFVAQNLCLVSQGLGLGACPVSGFAQDAAEQLLEVDGKQELAILMLTAGPLTGSPG